MNDNNLIKAQLWADVYGGTIKNGHSVAAATDRANDAVKEYEGRFGVKKDGVLNPQIRDAISRRICADAKSFYKTSVVGGIDLVAVDGCADSIMQDILVYEKWAYDSFDQIKELQKRLMDKELVISNLEKQLDISEDRFEQVSSALESIANDRDESVKKFESSDTANTPNPPADNLSTFISENADKLAEAPKDGDL